MSLEMIRLEVQEKQGEINSLQSKLSRLQAEFQESCRLEDRINSALPDTKRLQNEMWQAQDGIEALQRKIRALMDKARSEDVMDVLRQAQGQVESSGESQLRPLEALGKAAILLADGQMAEDEFEELLHKVRKTVE